MTHLGTTITDCYRAIGNNLKHYSQPAKMNIPSFEFLTPEEARIGKTKVNYYSQAPTPEFKWKYTIEATTDPRNKFLQNIELTELYNLRPKDIPNGINISIEHTPDNFREIDSVSISKIDDISEVAVHISIGFMHWHLPVTLQNFSKMYQKELNKFVKNITETTLVIEDFGVYITCKSLVPDNKRYLIALHEILNQSLDAYRESISLTYAPQNTQKIQKSDSSGSKWWIRYVLVPLIGSSAFAVAIAGAIAFFNRN